MLCEPTFSEVLGLGMGAFLGRYFSTIRSPQALFHVIFSFSAIVSFMLDK